MRMGRAKARPLFMASQQIQINWVLWVQYRQMSIFKKFSMVDEDQSSWRPYDSKEAGGEG